MNLPSAAPRAGPLNPTSSPVWGGFELPSSWKPTLKFILLASLFGVAAIRVRLLSIPLERDEGEYAYMAQLISQGIPPYQIACNMKWPGTYFCYYLIVSVFGDTQAGIHLGLIVVSTATTVALYCLAKRLAGDLVATVAASAQALLSVSPLSLGLAGHATHFVILPALISANILYPSRDRPLSAWRLLLGGTLIGVATLNKQAGALFALFCLYEIFLWLKEGDRWKKEFLYSSALFGLGCLIPLLSTLIYLSITGVLDRFWFWTVKYAAAYASILSLRDGLFLLGDSVKGLFKDSPFLWSFALGGVFVIGFDRGLRRNLFGVLFFAFCSFLAVCPGWYFRSHYFLLFFPALGLLAGVFIMWATRKSAAYRSLKAVPLFLFVAGAAVELYLHREVYFWASPEDVSRIVYGDNPFIESVEIGKYLAANCAPTGKIAVIGSEPQIYFYAKRRSATSYIYTYALMEPQPYASQMQREMIEEIEKGAPDFVVFVHVPTSWLMRESSSREIFEWFDRYRASHLDLLYLIQILDGKAVYTPSSSPEVRQLKTGIWMTVFRRKGLS